MNATVTTAHPPTTVRDSMTMLRRNLLHLARYPSLALMLTLQPVVFLLLFVYVFGGTMGAGLPGVPGGDRADYLAYITPTMLILTVVSVAMGTAISVAMDMTSGIIARFRTMDISQSSVLIGHVLGAVIKTVLALVVMVAVAILLGFRSDAGPADWLAVSLLLLLMTAGFTWLTVAMGLAAGNVETASNTPMILVLLPFVSSGFVPTDAMPPGLRQFAEHQPFTPMIETVRALAAGGSPGSDGALAVAWSLALGVVGFVWARHLFRQVPTR